MGIKMERARMLKYCMEVKSLGQGLPPEPGASTPPMNGGVVYP